MLQRAASNAYSWWWASHVRTKQSKWLEHNLQDMEEKVQSMLKIISDDGDSFAKRAEMYYRRRPELIQFVEESFRAYRALAERYEHIAGELQTANQTIATVFPERAQMEMDDDDEDGPPEYSTGSPIPGKIPQGMPEAPPNAPKFTMISKSTRPSSATKPQSKKTTTAANSQKSNTEALGQIDKLQKGILALQTEKEFVKGSYENGLAKYWKIEKQIAEMQKEVCDLQEEYGTGNVIEDDEARTLMAATALKSCQEMLIQLQEKQERSNEEAKIEDQRIKDVCKKLETLRNEYLHNCLEQQKSDHQISEKVKSEAQDPGLASAQQEAGLSKQESHEVESFCEKIREHLVNNSNASLDVTELAERIDELVTKVINLETSVSSQNALIDRLRSETNELHAKVHSLQEGKATLSEGSNNWNNKLQELDSELHGVQELNKNVEDHSNTLQMHFTEANSDFQHITEELQCVKKQDEVEGTNPFLEAETRVSVEVESQKKFAEQEDTASPSIKDQNIVDELSEKHREPKCQDVEGKRDASSVQIDVINDEPQGQAKDQEDQPNWQQLFLGGMEDREKILLVEYTTTLRNYKEVKKKLSEAEKKNQVTLTETTLEMRKLQNANSMMDEEIQSLRQKLKLLQRNSNKNLGTFLENENVATTSRPDGQSEAAETPTEDDEEVKVILPEEPHNVSIVEEKFRRDIDELLEENLKFWLRFSTAFHQIQKFQTSVEDLEADYSKLKENKKGDENASNNDTTISENTTTAASTSTTTNKPLKSEARPIYNHLTEIQNEMKVWLEQTAVLKSELQCRLSALLNIQEEISRVSKEGSDSENVEFTSYQAAKFQGEVVNMQQENNKVADELEAGLEHVRNIQSDIEKLLLKLKEDLELPGSKSNEDLKFHGSKKPEMRHSDTRSQVPLRSFLFGTKAKKQRPKLFTRIHPHIKSKNSF